MDVSAPDGCTMISTGSTREHVPKPTTVGGGRASAIRAGDRTDGVVLRTLGAWALVLFTFTMAGRIVSGDGEAMFQTTLSLVRRGALAIEARPETATGRDGRAYSKYGLGQSVVQAPFVAAGLAYGSALANPTQGERAARFLVGLANGVVTAAMVLVLWVIARDAGAGRGASTLIAVLGATTTLLAPYARADFAEPTQTLALLIATGASLRACRATAFSNEKEDPWTHQRVRWAAVAGIAVAVAFLTKAASLILAPAVLLPVGLATWRAFWGPHVPDPLSDLHENRPVGGSSVPPTAHTFPFSGGMTRGAGRAISGILPMAVAVGLPVAMAGALQATLNWYRFGNPFEFGYGDEPSTGFVTPILDGVGYLLFASGKGLAWFAPPAMVGLAGIAWLAQRRPLVAATAFSAFTLELLYYARWWAWHGDWSWGPRYLYVTVPFLMLGWLAPALAWPQLGTMKRALVVAAAAPVVLAGLWANILAVSVDYGSYYSVVGNQLGRGIDVRHARVVPEFSPLRGHAWLLQASLAASIGGYSAPSNPYRSRYPWADAHPELVPEAPERAYGFDPWWAARRGRDRFLDYWAGIVAAWLALALSRLTVQLWRLAGNTADGTMATRPLG